MRRVGVEIPGARYDVLIGEGLLSRVGPVLADEYRGGPVPGRLAVVTDATVEGLYAEEVLTSLADAGFLADICAVPAGEVSKDWDTAGELLERFADLGLDRDDAVVALGGGVVGDLAGFCAGVYMRGIAFVQVPTTLLAQVDSSVGGKTAVDLEAGKNLAGVFVQPRLVVADVGTLATLPQGEWLSGCAEVLKSAVLSGDDFLGWLESEAEALVRRESDAVADAVERCVRFKAGVVAADERETGLRESLNLGHTFGHALEKVAGYGVFPHGIAVGLGMRFAAGLAERLGLADHAFTRRQEALLDAVGLSVEASVTGFVPAAERSDMGDILCAHELRLAMGADKKARGGVVRFVLASAPGKHVVKAVSDDLLVKELDRFTGAVLEG